MSKTVTLGILHWSAGPISKSPVRISSAVRGRGDGPSSQKGTSFPGQSGVSRTFSRRVSLSVPALRVLTGYLFRVVSSHPPPRTQVNTELCGLWAFKEILLLGVTIHVEINI